MENPQFKDQKFGCGALRSKYDPTIPIFEKISQKKKTRDLLPTTLNYIPNMFAIRNQGAEGTCVAESSAAVKEWQGVKQIGLDEYMSPQFIYNNRANYPQDGMELADAMNILTSDGCCLETTYAYGTIQPQADIPQAAYTEAANYKIQTFAQITTVDGMKTALNSNGPCIIALPCYSHNPSWWFPNNPGDPYVGHCNA
jgi:hypothetical protein